MNSRTELGRSHRRALAPLLALLALVSTAVLLISETALAQAKGKPAEKSFLSLRDERDTAEKELRDAEKAVADLTLQQYWLKDEAAAKRELADLEKTGKKASPEEVMRLQKRSRDAREYAATPVALNEVEKALEQRQADLRDKRRQKERIETEINQKIDLEKPKQEFKTTISFYFTLLIGLVIVGFFVVATVDQTVRREIFSGQAGIQFITLFSVVIAIILFGITEILEGKELSALLGGLSGYILGRATATRGAATQAKVTSPRIMDIIPRTVTLPTAPGTLSVQIVGTDLQLANAVKIVQGAKEIPVSGITSSDVAINCTLALDPSLPKGAYDVTVTTSDGGVGKFPQSFTIQ